MSVKLSVPLTPDYRLTADGTQFIVEQRYITKPAVNPRPGYVYEPREAWREIGYYALTTKSLGHAIDHVIMRTATESGVETLADFGAAIRAASETIAAALDSATATVKSPQNYGELGALVGAKG